MTGGVTQCHTTTVNNQSGIGQQPRTFSKRKTNVAQSRSQRFEPPYVTAWSQEQYLPTELVQRNDRLAYANESPEDRDENGVLWYRSPSRRGQGQPEFNSVHPQRQREVMSLLLCQICAGPPDQAADGVLWLLSSEYDGDWADWPEGMAAAEPPVCRSCARRAIRQCPALRKGAAVVRVRDCPIVGVRGALYLPTLPSPQPAQQVIVAYTHSAIGWVRASSLLRELHGCMILPIDELLDPQEK